MDIKYFANVLFPRGVKRRNCIKEIVEPTLSCVERDIDDGCYYVEILTVMDQSAKNAGDTFTNEHLIDKKAYFFGEELSLRDIKEIYGEKSSQYIRACLSKFARFVRNAGSENLLGVEAGAEILSPEEIKSNISGTNCDN